VIEAVVGIARCDLRGRSVMFVVLGDWRPHTLTAVFMIAPLRGCAARADEHHGSAENGVGRHDRRQTRPTEDREQQHG
jgi:hypothetical protein